MALNEDRPKLEQLVLALINVRSAEEHLQLLQQHQNRLLADEAEGLLRQLIVQYQQNPNAVKQLQMHLEILQRARREGLAAAFSERLGGGMAGMPAEIQEIVQAANQAEQHYLQTSDVRYLDQAIQQWEQLLKYPNFTQWPEPLRLIIYNDGASPYLRRFLAKGQRTDLDRAIMLSETAVQTTPSDSLALPSLLSNLGNCLLVRFEVSGVVADLEESVIAYRRAVQTLPSGSPDSPRTSGKRE